MSENQASLLLRKQLKGEAIFLLFFFLFSTWVSIALVPLMMVCGVFSVLFGAVQIFVFCFAVYFSAGATFTSVPPYYFWGVIWCLWLSLLAFLLRRHKICCGCFCRLCLKMSSVLSLCTFCTDSAESVMCDDVSKPQSSVDIRLNRIGIILYVCF
jgi:hypothetical protein